MERMKRTIKVYKPCDTCEGTGLVDNSNGIKTECLTCLGYGEVVENIYREVDINDIKLPTGDV